MKNTRKMMAFLIGITLLTISPAYAPITTVRSQPNRCRDRRKSSLPGIFPVKKSPTQKKKAIFSKSFTK